MAEYNLTEQETRTRFITPALRDAGWEYNQMREEYQFTDGRISAKGKTVVRGQQRKIDYLLEYKPNIPLAIVEAKKKGEPLGKGMQQGLDYAEGLKFAKDLDVPFVYSSNGDGFLEHDNTGMSDSLEKYISLEEFPSPKELWQRFVAWKNYSDSEEKVVAQDYHYERGGKIPRYYQRIAINRTIEAYVKGQRRMLLVMATGTGKTFVASQIIWRLWKARQAERILFLADRNILVDQAMLNDFKQFGDKMHKITNRTVDKSYEIYTALYQAISGTEERQNIYKQYSPDFFDLIVIDECHRGSAAEDSAWREILDYFSGAAHLGLTATPKETKEVSNIEYFGEPLYTYSLKQGIDDGFLAPYRVIRVNLDVDLDGWSPDAGQVDKFGNEIPDKEFAQDDMERTIIIKERTELVAKRVTQFLQQTNRMDKTIVFCVDIDHAERMRQALVNLNADLATNNSRYIMRITGDSNEGKRELENFIASDEPYPVITTTSRLMTTGVDAKTCKLIVIDRKINSLSEFKQIVGRGTRIDEEYDKRFFTIMDFRNATSHFADPDFDGEPEQEEEFGQDEPIEVDFGAGGGEDVDKPLREPRAKYVVEDVPITIRHEWEQFLDSDGRLMTESFVTFSRDNLRQIYQSLDSFLRRWNSADRKEIIIAELLEQGIWLDKLQEEFGEDRDEFDLICYIAFDVPMMTRKERAQRVKNLEAWESYPPAAQAVLTALLDKYAVEGIKAIERAAEGSKIAQSLNVPPLNEIGTPIEIVKSFGGKPDYLSAVRQLEDQIYTITETQ